MKLRDFLNDEEIKKWNELEMELLSAHNDQERILIKAEMDELLDTARSRYEAFLAGKEQAIAIEKSPEYV